MTDVTGPLDLAVEEVLEGMFFSAVIGQAPERPPAPELAALVRFSGSREGALAAAASERTVTKLASSFLGDDEAAEAQTRATLGELANVLCGAALGRLEPEGRFSIAEPEVCRGAEAAALLQAVPVSRCFELDEGALIVGMELD